MPSRQALCDLYAVAIIAAARALGNDPVEALTVRHGPARRALWPAAYAISATCGVHVRSVAKVVGLGSKPPSTDTQFSHPYRRAFTAAMKGLESPRAEPPPAVIAPTGRGSRWVGDVLVPAAALAEEDSPQARPEEQAATSLVEVPVLPATSPLIWIDEGTVPGFEAVLDAVADITPVPARRSDFVTITPRPAPSLEPVRVPDPDRALIDQAVAAGRVTILDTGTAAGLSTIEQYLHAAPPPRPETGWGGSAVGVRNAALNRRRAELRKTADK